MVSEFLFGGFTFRSTGYESFDTTIEIPRYTLHFVVFLNGGVDLCIRAKGDEDRHAACIHITPENALAYLTLVRFYFEASANEKNLRKQEVLEREVIAPFKALYAHFHYKREQYERNQKRAVKKPVREDLSAVLEQARKNFEDGKGVYSSCD